MINIAHEEFVCYRFIHTVFEVMALAQSMVKEMENPKYEVTSDYFMRLHFDSLQKRLHIMLDDSDMMAAFRRRYADRADLLDLAAEQDAALDRLHNVRQALIDPHVNEDRTDVHNYHGDLFTAPVDLSVADKAQAYGLTEDQYTDWTSQVSTAGFLHLSMLERQKLADAIRAEFSGL